ncbi:MAG TPA: hypothetical protein VGM38_07785 [Pseudolysinimonas sp.]|jgi:hypothetical protein
MTMPRMLFALVGATILLSGCSVAGTHSPHATAGHTQHAGSSLPPTLSASPTAEPSGAASPAALPPNAIIRITTTVTASTGAVAKLVETVLAPQASTGGENAAMTAAGCDDSTWKTQFPHPAWVHVNVVTSLLSGSVWPSEDVVLTLSGTYWGYAAWSGQQHGFEAPCSDGIQDIPGTSAAVVPADPSAAAGSQTSATGGSFGFAWASDADDPSNMHFAFTSCTIEIGPAAGAAAATFVRVPASDGYPVMCYTPGA